MTLFVVVQKSKRTGEEYLALDSDAEGFTEYSAAVDTAVAVELDAGDDFDVYVGRVVPVTEET